MALIGYVDIPDITGMSHYKDHEGQIDFHGLRWEVTQMSAAVPGGKTSSRAKISGLTIYKWCDSSTPYLAHAAMSGSTVGDITFYVSKASGENYIDYLKIAMEKSFVSGYEMLDPSFGPDDPQEIREKVTFTCDLVTITYTEQGEDFTAGPEHEKGYNIAEASPA